jgi:hypothetical protein
MSSEGIWLRYSQVHFRSSFVHKAPKPPFSRLVPQKNSKIDAVATFCLPIIETSLHHWYRQDEADI